MTELRAWKEGDDRINPHFYDSYRKAGPPEYVYFGRKEDGRIKVGVSIQPGRRTKTLGCELLLAVEADRDTEQEVLRYLDSHRIEGEWFHPTSEVLDYIESLQIRAV